MILVNIPGAGETPTLISFDKRQRILATTGTRVERAVAYCIHGQHLHLRPSDNHAKAYYHHLLVPSRRFEESVPKSCSVLPRQALPFLRGSGVKEHVLFRTECVPK